MKTLNNNGKDEEKELKVNNRQNFNWKIISMIIYEFQR